MLEQLQQDITRLISLYEQEKQRADKLAESLAQSKETIKVYKEQITPADGNDPEAPSAARRRPGDRTAPVPACRRGI